MDSIVVRGGTPLNGQIQIAGAKNTSLKLITAALLTDEPVTLTNVPKLADIRATFGPYRRGDCVIAWRLCHWRTAG